MSPREGDGPSNLVSALLGAVVLALFLGGAELALGLAGVRPLAEEGGLRAGYSTRVPLYVPDGGGDLVTAERKLRFFNAQRFAAVKPSGTRRIFCVGGSTVYGRPHDDTTSFCGWLRRLLPRAEPRGRFEVVNAGGISYGSARALGVMQELAGHAPDAFVIFTGHNEFLERRTHAESLTTPAWLRAVDERLRGTRLYSALRRRIDPWKQPAPESGEVDTLLDRAVGLDAYTRDDALRERVIAEFRGNLIAMVETARRAGAVPLLVVPASNTADCSPFKSEFSSVADPAERERLTLQLDEAWRALEAGRALEARDAFAVVAAADSRHAGALYGLGRSERALGDERAAASALRRARAEDVCPLRALEPMQRAVREVATELEVPRVDFPVLLAGEPTPILGAADFLDHVHPTPDAHGRLALALVSALAEAGAVAPGVGFGEADLEAVARDLAAEVDTREQGLALRNLAKVLSWSGKTEDAARSARQALALLGEDAECSFILGVAAIERGRADEAIAHYTRALELEPDYTKARNNLGVAYARAGRWADAVDTYQGVLLEDPAHTGARFNLANALVKLGRVDAGIAHYRELLRDEPDDVDAHYNLARVYERRGDVDRALQHYREVLAREPDAVDARRALDTL